jgi:hypothetical protein
VQQPAGIVDRHRANNGASNQKQDGIEKSLTPPLIGCIISPSKRQNACDRKHWHQARTNRLERFQEQHDQASVQKRIFSRRASCIANLATTEVGNFVAPTDPNDRWGTFSESPGQDAMPAGGFDRSNSLASSSATFTSYQADC